ncbi:hypothetical protein, partial [Klebsiella pneumoniae]|uniref:hypothetical protein n=1 Tax=Klebsiella pneumoniae TaxID=573 RepID=UPI0038535F45
QTTAYLIDTANNNGIDSRGNTGQYIDLIVTLYASTSHTSAPILNLLNLSFTSPAAPNSKIWQTSDDWNTGRLIQNLNIDFSSGVMTIADTSRIGEFT